MVKKWRVLLLDTKKSNPNHYICLAIKEAFAAHPLTDIIVKADYGSAIARARANNCNLFVAFDGEELERGICARLASICGTSVLWVTEDPYELNINKANSNFFDLVFTNDSGSVSAYGRKGCHLPFAASPQIHLHELCEDDDVFLYDLFFVGTAWPNRVKFLKNLEDRLAGLKLKIALPSNPHLPEPELKMTTSAYLWKTPNSEFARFANRSRVTLTLHRNFSASGNDSTAQTPGPRLFEVALAGGFQLVDMSLPEVTRYFDEDTQFAGFRSDEECIEKLKFYLSNSDKRITMTRSAQERAFNEHLYCHRINTIYSKIAILDKPEICHILKQRQKVLFVTHNIQSVKPYGGVEVYQQVVINSLKEHFQFFIYAVDRTIQPPGRKCNLYDENMTVIETHDFNVDIPDSVLSCPDRERTFSGVLSRFGIEIVHFQHLMGHPHSLPYISKALGIPSIFSLHDYYAICHHFNLIGYQGHYCNISELPSVSCDICLNVKNNAAVGSQAARRAFWGRVLEQVDVLHANTDGVASFFREIFPNLRLSNKFNVCGVPMPMGNATNQLSCNLRSRDPVHVAIIGNFTQAKGADVIIQVLNQMRDEQIIFHIFGAVIEPYETILNVLKLPNVKVHGAYKAGEINEQLKTMSISLHLSIWPETYCIALSEAWHAGLVPIVSDIGALGERVIHGINGFKVPVAEGGSVVDILRKLIAQPERIEKVRMRTDSGFIVSHDIHMSWLKDSYETLSRDFSLLTRQENNHLPLCRISLSDCSVVLTHNTWIHDNNCQQSGVQVIINNSGTFVPTLKILWRYIKNYGIRATATRVMREVEMIARRSGTIKGRIFK